MSRNYGLTPFRGWMWVWGNSVRGWMWVGWLPAGRPVCPLANAFGVEAFGMNICDGAPAVVARPRTPRSRLRRQIKQPASPILLVAVLLEGGQ